MKASEKKTVKAWAVITEKGRLQCWDYRLPLTWIRRCAIEDRAKQCFRDDSQIVRATITYTVPKRVKNDKA